MMKYNGFEKIKMSISGDDDLFLQLVRRQTPWKIRYIKTQESFVPTIPPVTFWSFVEQRKRHFSAAKFFTVPMMLFFFIYHSSNLLLLISPLLFLMNAFTLPVLIIVCCSKLAGDIVLFKYSHRTFDTSISIAHLYSWKHCISFTIHLSVLWAFLESLYGSRVKEDRHRADLEKC